MITVPKEEKLEYKDMKMSDFLNVEIQTDAESDAWWDELQKRSPFDYLFDAISDLEAYIDTLKEEVRKLRELLQRHTHNATGKAEVLKNVMYESE